MVEGKIEGWALVTDRSDGAIVTIGVAGELTKPLTPPDLKSDVLINQSGETFKLDYNYVKAEANKLVKIDEHGEQKGFLKAEEIVLSYGVDKLNNLGNKFYPEIVEKFRKAVNEWK